MIPRAFRPVSLLFSDQIRDLQAGVRGELMDTVFEWPAQLPTWELEALLDSLAILLRLPIASRFVGRDTPAIRVSERPFEEPPNGVGIVVTWQEDRLKLPQAASLIVDAMIEDAGRRGFEEVVSWLHEYADTPGIAAMWLALLLDHEEASLDAALSKAAFMVAERLLVGVEPPVASWVLAHALTPADPQSRMKEEFRAFGLALAARRAFERGLLRSRDEMSPDLRTPLRALSDNVIEFVWRTMSAAAPSLVPLVLHTGAPRRVRVERSSFLRPYGDAPRGLEPFRASRIYRIGLEEPIEGIHHALQPNGLTPWCQVLGIEGPLAAAFAAEELAPSCEHVVWLDHPTQVWDLLAPWLGLIPEPHLDVEDPRPLFDEMRVRLSARSCLIVVQDTVSGRDWGEYDWLPHSGVRSAARVLLLSSQIHEQARTTASVRCGALTKRQILQRFDAAQITHAPEMLSVEERTPGLGLTLQGALRSLREEEGVLLELDTTTLALAQRLSEEKLWRHESLDWMRRLSMVVPTAMGATLPSELLATAWSRGALWLAAHRQRIQMHPWLTAIAPTALEDSRPPELTALDPVYAARDIERVPPAYWRGRERFYAAQPDPLRRTQSTLLGLTEDAYPPEQGSPDTARRRAMASLTVWVQSRSWKQPDFGAIRGTDAESTDPGLARLVSLAGAEWLLLSSEEDASRFEHRVQRREVVEAACKLLIPLASTPATAENADNLRAKLLLAEFHLRPHLYDPIRSGELAEEVKAVARSSVLRWRAARISYEVENLRGRTVSRPPFTRGVDTTLESLRRSDVFRDAPIPLEWVRRETERAALADPLDLGLNRKGTLRESALRWFIKRRVLAGTLRYGFTNYSAVVPFFVAQVPRRRAELDECERIVLDAANPAEHDHAQIASWFQKRRDILET